jgi:hypothetical protein
MGPLTADLLPSLLNGQNKKFGDADMSESLGGEDYGIANILALEEGHLA